MLPILRRIAAAATVLAAVPAVFAPPALAEDAWTVSPGGAVTATGAVRIQNVSRGWSIDCGQATFGGHAESGAGDQFDPLVEFDETTFENCAGPDGVGYTVTMTSGVQLEMYASSYNAGRTTGTLFGFQLNLVGTNRCQADVADPAGNLGTADATFTNETSTLALDGGNMGVTFVNFACPSTLISTGDDIVVATRLSVTPPQTISTS